MVVRISLESRCACIRLSRYHFGHLKGFQVVMVVPRAARAICGTRVVTIIVFMRNAAKVESQAFYTYTNREESCHIIVKLSIRDQ